MAKELRIIHYLNQFFGGLGGEEQADHGLELVEGAKGPGLLLAKEGAGLTIIATLIGGDNYLAQDAQRAETELVALLEPLMAGSERPDLLVAGPAFNAGRYGLACGLVCKVVQEHFAIPCLTAMFPDNPGVAQYRQDVYIVKSGDNVMAMAAAIQAMAELGRKLVAAEEVWPEEDGYIVQGRRRNIFVEQTGAQRAVAMLLSKMRGEAFATEYEMPVFDRVAPAPAIVDMIQARLALVTSGGIVPKGNPDRIEAANAHRFGSYSLHGLKALGPETHQTAHGGYDPTFANEDPNRVVPLDAVYELVQEGAIGSLHDHYYATVGNATAVAKASKFGQDIAKILVADGVQAVIFTST